jgi:myosin heavy subunit
MSEANAPFNPQSQPESLDSPASVRQELGPDEVTGGADAANQPSVNSLELSESLEPLAGNTIFDASELDGVAFEDGESEISAAEESTVMPSSQTLPSSVATNLSSIAAWSQDAVNRSEAPNLSDLIALIQELNQCNGVLMDRVSQLEEALEDSQSALQAEVGRTQDVHSYNAQDWATVQEQVTNLFNQLEFAHQTNQRQQILIETLTGQLETSQERVAQLEREAALIQQRYNEQNQLLTKSETTCRDLQARLQRQQRYTLQFKAALEKCLEVPTPQYEAAAVSSDPAAEVLAEAPFLPKAQRIQPWSAQTSIKSPWMKLHQLDLSAEELQSEPINVSSSAPAPASATQTTHLNLPSFDLPLLHLSSDNDLDDSLVDAAPPAASNAALVDANLDANLEAQVQQLANDPVLKQQLDQVVQPLADLLAEALLSDQPAEPAEPVEHPNQANSSSADELLAATMADAEDALWQDLARLIDVSTEDVVKASLSGDLAAFESIDFASLPAEQPTQTSAGKAETPTPQAPQAVVPEFGGDASAVAPLVRRISQAHLRTTEESEGNELEAVEQQERIPALASSWPSPVVYPLRTSKKRQSLAMVDLPTFPRG